MFINFNSKFIIINISL